ncbi:MAG TPA: SpoIIIAH-like family protein [Candidatus Eubacterium faecipullorum]|uniref:SpoIIIAH-like family protein n=1 Tax=Candidatus Eubacterium faecipullorum TaxID=2838571 RepID=A0A9D1RCX5_9FIRM|nr:SpoIIIAH-like family protein [Candidatus Eubacterium faecipullorum]
MEEINEKNNNIEIEGLTGEEKVKKRKSRKRKILVSVFVLLLALGIGGNWYWENSDISSKISAVSSSAKTLGEATFVDADAEVTTSSESEYFSSARLERQTARDSALEKLQAVIDAPEESEDAHKLAAEQIAAISSYIEIENKIETLVQAKGVANCLAVVSEDGTRVDVIIDSAELSDDLALQIKDIATTQLNCGFENVTIIQSASQ